MSKFPELQAMLEGNEQWSEALNTQEPDFFATSAKGQVSLVELERAATPRFRFTSKGHSSYLELIRQPILMLRVRHLLKATSPPLELVPCLD